MEERRTQFEAIYDAHFDYVWNSLRQLSIPERDLEDVCHEVFLVVFRKLDEYDSNRPVQPWLYGIAFRVASDYREKASHAREKLTDPDPPAEPPEVLDQLAAEEAREVIHEALQHVALERRAVLVLKELKDHPMKDVAEALSIPVKTAYSRLRVAREEMKEAVQSIVAERETDDG